MKSTPFTISIALTLLLVAFAAPLRLAAQDAGVPSKKAQHHHYKLIDMGTFGGSESAVNFPVDLNNRAVNKHGVTVGFSATSTHKLPHSDPIMCGGDDGYGSFITHAFRWQDGTVTDLGALPPQKTNCSNAYQVNASGEIAGFSENGKFDPLVGFNQSRAVRWKNAVIEDLGSFGGNQNAAFAINNRGQIVGASENAIPDQFSCLGPSSNQCRAFLWQHGQMQDLGTLGTGNDAFASYINERSQIAGWSSTSTTANPVTGVPPQDPFLWDNGQMVDLGSLGGAVGLVSGLNNRGQVIGVSSVAANPAACFTEGDPNCHPFLWSQGTLIDLNTTTSGGAPLSVEGINDARELVGSAAFADAPFDAYLWRNGVAIDLGRLEGDCFSGGNAINSHGQVAGNSFSCNGEFGNNLHHAFLWENGSIVDLNSLIPADSTLQLAAAWDINDRGEIAGIGVPPGVDPHKAFTDGYAFLLIPCDDDHLGLEGCDYSMVEAAEAENNVPGARSLQVIPQPPACIMRMMSASRNPFTRRYRLPGLRPSSSD